MRPSSAQRGMRDSRPPATRAARSAITPYAGAADADAPAAAERRLRRIPHECAAHASPLDPVFPRDPQGRPEGRRRCVR